MTLEEQLAKSESRANLEAPPPEEDEVDEMDDIDRVRDDLQSTKQLLAMELRNNEALERENKRLLQRVQNLEAELSRERWNPLSGEEKSSIAGPDAELIHSLKKEAVEAQQQSKQLEEKYQTVAKELDTATKQNEEQKRKIADLEKKLQVRLNDLIVPPCEHVVISFTLQNALRNVLQIIKISSVVELRVQLGYHRRMTPPAISVLLNRIRDIFFVCRIEIYYSSVH